MSAPTGARNKGIATTKIRRNLRCHETDQVQIFQLIIIDCQFRILAGFQYNFLIFQKYKREAYPSNNCLIQSFVDSSQYEFSHNFRFPCNQILHHINMQYQRKKVVCINEFFKNRCLSKNRFGPYVRIIANLNRRLLPLVTKLKNDM